MLIEQRLTGLKHSAVYRLRVVALGADDIASPASDIAQLITPDSDDYTPPGPSSADSVFSIECGGDVVVGDRLLWTEDVPVDTETDTTRRLRQLAGTSGSASVREGILHCVRRCIGPPPHLDRGCYVVKLLVCLRSRDSHSSCAPAPMEFTVQTVHGHLLPLRGGAGHPDRPVQLSAAPSFQQPQRFGGHTQVCMASAASHSTPHTHGLRRSHVGVVCSVTVHDLDGDNMSVSTMAPDGRRGSRSVSVMMTVLWSTVSKARHSTYITAQPCLAHQPSPVI